MNNVKEIEVTDDFLTLDQTIINCQNDESLEDCQTRKYVNEFVEQCKCFPFAIRKSHKVILCHSNKPKMAYSRDLPKMARQQCTAVWHYGLTLQ